MNADSNNVGLWRAAVHKATELLKVVVFDDFFHLCAGSLANLLQADGAALIVVEENDLLRYRLFYGLERINQESITKFCFSPDRGTVGRALETGSYLFTPDYQKSPDAMEEFIAAGICSNLVMPLPGPHGFVGAIAISWINRPAGSLESPNLDIASMFAALIGSAVYRERLEEQLRSSSLTDSLTGLPNRRMLMLHLLEAQRRACRAQTLMAVAVLDLDGFKLINDRLGHLAGDQVLVASATRLKGSIRNTDLVARYGGDEFVLVLEDLKSQREVDAILERILQAARNQPPGSGSWSTSASIGVAVYPIDFSEPEILLCHADEAMYVAKRAGGDRFFVRTLVRLSAEDMPDHGHD